LGTDRLGWGIQRERPLVIAHRGASADALENTVSAFRRARADGADGVELDVMRCATGEIVVFHDDDLQRLAHRDGWTRDLSYHELSEIILDGGEHIPLLGEVLEEIGPLLVNVELKSAPQWPARLVDAAFPADVASLLRRFDVGDRALVSSFDPLLLARFRMHAPEFATGLLFASDQARPFRDAWTAPLLRPAAMHPERLLVDAARVRGWHAAGRAVNVWTVDDPAELRLLAALGVDGVITNRPKFARSVLHS
jgi:glycerophosphoryl diester phosphodiesterase